MEEKLQIYNYTPFEEIKFDYRHVKLKYKNFKIKLSTTKIENKHNSSTSNQPNPNNVKAINI